MAIAFLNDDFVPLEEARISPMDRGFLFGDGIYEVIPSYGGKLIGLDLHLTRLENGLNEIKIDIPWNRAALTAIFKKLMDQNGNGNLGIYLQITRGVTMKRNHAFPATTTPTLFAYSFDIPAPVTSSGFAVAALSYQKHLTAWQRASYDGGRKRRRWRSTNVRCERSIDRGSGLQCLRGSW